MFSFLKGKPAPGISRAESLNGKPVVSPGVHIETNPDGEKVLLIERRISEKESSWIKSFFGVSIVPKQVILDDLGQFVFNQVDGRRTVKQIIDRFAGQYKLHPREAETGVVEFLNMLMKRNVISIVFDRDPFKK